MKYCALRKVKLSVPHIVPKAHFMHEVRFTCEAYFTFRISGTLISKKEPFVWKTKGSFFVVDDNGLEPLTLRTSSGCSSS